MGKHCERRHNENKDDRHEDDRPCVETIYGFNLLNRSLGLLLAISGVIPQTGDKKVNKGQGLHTLSIRHFLT